MFQTIAIAAGILIAAILGFAATKPGKFRVQRTKSIQAPPEKLFALVNDFRKWGSWSPFEKLDPAMKRTFSGAPSGLGAVYEWQGQGQAGAGRMEITDTSSPSRVTIKLDFSKPFEAHHTAEFTFEADGGRTNITWAMHGRQAYLCKVMSIFFSMDRMIGKEFEKGLANLQAIVERQAGESETERQVTSSEGAAVGN